jgi:hypothetical protein
MLVRLVFLLGHYKNLVRRVVSLLNQQTRLLPLLLDFLRLMHLIKQVQSLHSQKERDLLNFLLLLIVGRYKNLLLLLLLLLNRPMNSVVDSDILLIVRSVLNPMTKNYSAAGLLLRLHSQTLMTTMVLTLLNSCPSQMCWVLIDAMLVCLLILANCFLELIVLSHLWPCLLLVRLLVLYVVFLGY